MKQEYIFILHAKHSKHKHDFIELFTSIEQLEGFLYNHPEIIKTSITWHEVNPD